MCQSSKNWHPTVMLPAIGFLVSVCDEVADEQPVQEDNTHNQDSRERDHTTQKQCQRDVVEIYHRPP